MIQDITRREFCHGMAASACAIALGGFSAVARAQEATAGFPAPEDMEFLKDIARATVEAAHVAPGANKPGGGVNSTGITVITPGGNYPAFWIRDYAMSLDCGLIGPEEILPQLKLIASRQSGPKEKKLNGGCVVPPFSIADRIAMDGRPIYSNSTEILGCNKYGTLPPADNHFYFIHIAWAYWRDTQDAGFLSDEVSGAPIIDRLIKAFNAPEVNPATGAVTSLPPRGAVGFGFDDSVYMQGELCFATLLRLRAARQMAELCGAAKMDAEEKEFLKAADVIAENFMRLFGDPQELGGWLRGATIKCRQPDVWATLFALRMGVLTPEAEAMARDAVVKATRSENHEIEYQGAVRHVPTTHDFSDSSAWEDAMTKKGIYQNGAYWHTATGWLIEAIHPVDRSLALSVFQRYIAHLREYDFRKGVYEAPWECFGIDLNAAQNPVYMTSVTLPLGVLQKMKW